MFLRLSALAVASALVAGAAFAEDVTVSQRPAAEGVRTKTVTVGDLNLAKPEGQATLQTRIRAAARAVCEGGDLRDVRAFHERDACMANAIEGAMRQALPTIANSAAPDKAG
jgi:UrcA family protein